MDIYDKLLEMECTHEEYSISKDVFRTVPESSKFQEPIKSGKNKLFNVLKAYSCFDNEIGYVQGVNYLASLLLMYIDDENSAFWCLVYLLDRRNWRQIYSVNTPKLHSILELVKE